MDKQTFHDRAEPITLHFLFIDTHETCAMEIHQGVAVLQRELSSESDLTIVMIRTTFRALLEERIDMPEARERGLLVVEDADLSLTDVVMMQSPDQRESEL